ncbi:hypothetical protein ISN44_As08g036240 [Arabidopsis suecica]|uniref:RNA-directed DNA polymerase, eukaryota, Reverse transcriptase zinc-binding domain protein n=1 Tax=Arabidopsis suecica TaxID=45249 RepID=A0A8T2BFB7_ARASU|nr:hypothetical protein ISN44_As08g036240 [Arabidopsis suecica]
MDCLIWLLSASRDKNLSLIIKLIFQASIYFIWKERNLRIHSGVARHSNLIIKEIQLIVRARLDPLSRLRSECVSYVPVAWLLSIMYLVWSFPDSFSYVVIPLPHLWFFVSVFLLFL